MGKLDIVGETLGYPAKSYFVGWCITQAAVVGLLLGWIVVEPRLWWRNLLSITMILLVTWLLYQAYRFVDRGFRKADIWLASKGLIPMQTSDALTTLWKRLLDEFPQVYNDETNSVPVPVAAQAILNEIRKLERAQLLSEDSGMKHQERKEFNDANRPFAQKVEIVPKAQLELMLDAIVGFGSDVVDKHFDSYADWKAAYTAAKGSLLELFERLVKENETLTADALSIANQLDASERAEQVLMADNNRLHRQAAEDERLALEAQSELDELRALIPTPEEALAILDNTYRGLTKELLEKLRKLSVK